MYSCGIDLVEISRVAKCMKNRLFLERFFSVEERRLFEQKKQASQTVAANFAAKEAFSKALGTGMRGFALKEVSVLRDGLGTPYFAFEGKAAELVRGRNLAFSVSLTHTRDMAAAVVIAYVKEEKQLGQADNI